MPDSAAEDPRGGLRGAVAVGRPVRFAGCAQRVSYTEGWLYLHSSALHVRRAVWVQGAHCAGREGCIYGRTHLWLSCTEKCQLDTEIPQLDTEIPQLDTEKSQFETARLQYDICVCGVYLAGGLVIGTQRTL